MYNATGQWIAWSMNHFVTRMMMNVTHSHQFSIHTYIICTNRVVYVWTQGNIIYVFGYKRTRIYCTHKPQKMCSSFTINSVHILYIYIRCAYILMHRRVLIDRVFMMLVLLFILCIRIYKACRALCCTYLLLTNI